MSTSGLHPGTVIDGYEIVGLLGRGGMGFVYRVRRGESEYALKTLALEVADDSEEVARFQREAELLGALRHPGLVRVNAAGHKPGFFYFVMRLIQGESLEDRLKRTGPLPAEEAARITLAVADAIAHAHERGIVHRDLKPANIMLETGDDRPIVMDFGLGRRLGESDGERLTRTGEIIGTPAFVAPEQAFGVKSELDEKTDVYGLGALLYSMLSGRAPFDGPSALVIMKRVSTEPPAPLEGVAPELEAFVLRAMAKRREDRPATARAFMAELEAAARPRGVLPAYVWILVLLALATAAATLVLVKTTTSPSPPPPPETVGLVAPLDSICGCSDTVTRRQLGDRARPFVLTARGPEAATAARMLVRAAHGSFERGELPLAARRYETARLTDATALDQAAEARRLAAWIAAGDPDREGLERYAAQLTGELEPPLLAPCSALIESGLACHESDRLIELGRLQSTAEHLPEQSPLRRRVAEAWVQHAARTYDAWRRDRFGFDEKEGRALTMAKLGGGDLNPYFQRRGKQIFEVVRRIFDAFGRALLVDPTGERFPKDLSPCLTLVRLFLKPDRPPWGDTQMTWDEVMGRLYRAEHPVALYARARLHKEERGDCFQRAVDGLRAAPRDDRHVRAFAHGLAEMGHDELRLPREQLMPLVALADYGESWSLVGVRGKDHELLPQTLKDETFFLDEVRR